MIKEKHIIYKCKYIPSQEDIGGRSWFIRATRIQASGYQIETGLLNLNVWDKSRYKQNFG